MPKKIRKIIQNKYKVCNDGVNIIALKKVGSINETYIPCKLQTMPNGVFAIRLNTRGIDMYILTNKQYRRILTFLEKGLTVYVIGEYKNTY